MRSALAIVFAVTLLLVSPTRALRAEQTTGTDYTGTHEAGGILRLTLSLSDDMVVALDVDGIAGGGCSWEPIDLSNWGGSTPVADGHFDATNADGDRLTGQFTPPGQAQGTILVHDPVKGCETPPLRWVARTGP